MLLSKSLQICRFRHFPSPRPSVITKFLRSPTLKPKAYEVSVFFPPDVIESDRPTWLDLAGLRKPYSVSGSQYCQDQYPCLIEARYADEGDDAIPADRLVLNPVEKAERLEDRLIMGSHGVTQASLYLRPGTYHILSTNEANRTLYRADITVEGPPTAAGSP